MATAHTGDRLFAIPFLPPETLDAIRLDGQVDDWVEVLGEPTFTALDFTPETEPAALRSYDRYDPANLDFRVWIGWTEAGRLWGAAECADDYYFADPERRFTLGDSFSLLVDGDHSGGPYSYVESHGLNETREPDPRNNRQAQHYAAKPEAAGAPVMDVPFVALTVDRWMVEPPFADGAGGVAGENPTFWTVEFFVTAFDEMDLEPGGSRVSELAAGQIIGLDLLVTDQDEETGNAVFHLTDVNNAKGKGADWFGDVLLLGPDDRGAGSAVATESWARIKASLGD